MGEKVAIDDSGSNATVGFVRSINRNTGAMVLYDAVTGGSPVDISMYTTSESAKIYLVAAQADGFTSIPSMLLSSANGGATTIAGLTKTSYPILQARNIDGSGYTASTLLENLFDAFYTVAQEGMGNPTEIVVGYGAFKNCVKSLEVNRHYAKGEMKAGYGFNSLELVGPEGNIKLTAVRGANPNLALILDWNDISFHGDKFFEKQRHFDGLEAYLVRNTTGYEYYIDIKLYGEALCVPRGCGVVYSIPDAAVA